MGIKKNNPGCNCCCDGLSTCIDEFGDPIQEPITQVNLIIAGLPDNLSDVLAFCYRASDDSYIQLGWANIATLIEGTYSILFSSSECQFVSDSGTIYTGFPNSPHTTPSGLECNPGVPAVSFLTGDLTIQYTISYDAMDNSVTLEFFFSWESGNEGYMYFTTGSNFLCAGDDLIDSQTNYPTGCTFLGPVAPEDFSHASTYEVIY
jgi:hypothetical protein